MAGRVSIRVRTVLFVWRPVRALSQVLYCSTTLTLTDSCLTSEIANSRSLLNTGYAMSTVHNYISSWRSSSHPEDEEFELERAWPWLSRLAGAVMSVIWLSTFPSESCGKV